MVQEFLKTILNLSDTFYWLYVCQILLLTVQSHIVHGLLQFYFVR